MDTVSYLTINGESREIADTASRGDIADLQTDVASVTTKANSTQTEVQNARKSAGKTYSNLDARLDAIDTRIDNQTASATPFGSAGISAAEDQSTATTVPAATDDTTPGETTITVTYAGHFLGTGTEFTVVPTASASAWTTNARTAKNTNISITTTSVSKTGATFKLSNKSTTAQNIYFSWAAWVGSESLEVADARQAWSDDAVKPSLDARLDTDFGALSNQIVVANRQLSSTITNSISGIEIDFVNQVSYIGISGENIYMRGGYSNTKKRADYPDVFKHSPKGLYLAMACPWGYSIVYDTTDGTYKAVNTTQQVFNYLYCFTVTGSDGGVHIGPLLKNSYANYITHRNTFDEIANASILTEHSGKDLYTGFGSISYYHSTVTGEILSSGDRTKYYGWTNLCPIDTTIINPLDEDRFFVKLINCDYSTGASIRLYRGFYDENGTLIDEIYNTAASLATAMGALESDSNILYTWFNTSSIPEGTKYIHLFAYANSGTLSPRKNTRITLEHTWAPDMETVFSESSIDYKIRDIVFNKATVEKSRNLNNSVTGNYYHSMSNDTPARGRWDANSLTHFGMRNWIEIDEDKDYTISFKGCTATIIYYAFADANWNVLVNTTIAGPTNTVHSPINAKYCKVFTYNKNSSSRWWDYNSTIQIEEGTIATDYVKPYVFVDTEARLAIENIQIPEPRPYPYPEYWDTTIANAIQKIKTNMLDIGQNGDSFIFVTDTHWRNNCKNSPGLIQAILEQTNCKMVINGGDNLQGHLTTLNGAVDEIIASVNAFIFPGYRCLGVMGNHDLNSNNNPDYPESHLNPTKVYSVVNAAYRYDDLRYSTFANDNSYYYDSHFAKIRYLLLDWRIWYYYRTAASLPAAMLQWIQSVMTTIPEGYKVVIICHGIYAGGANVVLEIPIIPNTFEPYLNNILFFLQGHAHVDAVMYPYENNNTPVILTRNDSLTGTDRTAGTITEQCFDVVSFDYVNQLIKIVRVGIGNDRTIDLTQRWVDPTTV